jgi:hypothetical protein
MRFELFLIELPKAPLAKVQAALSELPKGASTGTILKSMEARKVPTVSVAWSDDKRVLNEVMDTLVELGAGVKLVDHGSLVEKLATFAAEKAGRARYLEDDDDPDSRKYVKLKQAKRSESIGAAMLRHSLTYFLQLVVAGVLFVWFAALRMGMERAFSAPTLLPEFGACALGLLVAYVSTASVRSVQAGRMTVLRILPQMILGAALTVASLFFLGKSGSEQTVADGKVKRPPSLPYSGLLTELRRRKQASEASGRDGDDESGGEGELGALGEGEEEELWCERPEPVAAPVCEGGRAWEDAQACLQKPEPTQPASKPRRVAKRKAVKQEQEPVVELAEPAKVAPVERPWGVTLVLSTVLALAAMWLLSLLGLYMQLRPRRGGQSKPLRDDEPAAGDAAVLTPAQAPVPTPADAAPSAELLALRQERTELRSALDEALTTLATGQPVPQKEPTSDNAQLAQLQHELGLARAALGANQTAIAELKRELTAAAMRESALHVELSEVRLELGQEADLGGPVGHALPESPARPMETSRADNDGGGRNTGLTRQLPASADESSYSVNQVQEERVVLGKRRKP